MPIKNVNFTSSWKKPIDYYYRCIKNGDRNRKAVRQTKRAFKMSEDEFIEFKRRVQVM